MKKIFKITVIFSFLILFIGSCTEDFEEMNTDPNNPVSAPAKNIMVNAIRATGDSFFDDWQGMNNFMSYAGQVTKIQYIDEARYGFREGVVNTAWANYYLLLNDLKKAQEIAKEDENPRMEAAAKTFSVMLWQMATDQWRDIPFTEALQGEDGIITPTYDTQDNIYPALLTMAKEAADQFATATTGNVGGSFDILYGGSVEGWQRFCNSLRLRLAIRISNVSPALAQQHIEEVLGNPTTYPIIDANSWNAQLQWPGASPYKEPWQENSETRDDHGMAETLIDTLLNLSDPRLPVIAKPATATGTYVGFTEGSADDPSSLAGISRMGAYYRDNPEGFTFFFRASESMFIVAEAALNGWNVGTYAASAQDAYEAGITLSMEEHSTSGNAGAYGANITAGDIATYIAQPGVAWTGTAADDRVLIAKQKWIALFKQGQEAWAEQRRTDFPAVAEAPGSPYGTHDRQPFRYPYPLDEQNLNSDNASTYAANVVDNFWGQQMWWDTRTGLN